MTTAPALGASDVHIWSCSLERAPEEVAARAAVLAPDERERAGRFRFDRDRRRFVIGRSVLREILGEYLGEPAERLTFSYDEHGKPRFERASGGPPLFFNASHSHDVALYAIAPVDRVGIDVERVRAMADLESIARRLFSHREQSALAGMQGNARTEAFFHCWTRKEAIVKAIGASLSLHLGSLDVPIASDALPCLVRLPHTVSHIPDWSLHEVRPPAEYVGAVALPGDGWRVVSLPAHDAQQQPLPGRREQRLQHEVGDETRARADPERAGRSRIDRESRHT